MGVLEGLVITTIVLAGAYVGYHAWQESLDADPGAATHSAYYPDAGYGAATLAAGAAWTDWAGAPTRVMASTGYPTLTGA